MPIMDGRLVLSDSQTLSSMTSANDTKVSTNVIDLSGGLAKDFRGNTIHPDPMRDVSLNVQVEDADLKGSGGTAELEISVYNHTAATSIGSGTLVARYVVNTITTSPGIVDGKFLVKDASLPAGKITKRYLGIVYKALSNGIAATSKVTAWLGTSIVNNDAHNTVSGL